MPQVRPVTLLNLGIVTIPIGTILALALVPNDPAVSGALFWSAWAMTLGLMGCLANDLFRRGPIGAMRAQHLLTIAVAVIAYGELLQFPYISSLDPDVIRKGLLAIGLFSTMVALGSSLPVARLPGAVSELASRQYPIKVVFRILLACWFLQMFNYFSASDFSLTKMVNALLLDRWSAPWSRGALRGWDAFRDFLTNFGYVVPTFTVILALRRGTWRKHDVMIGLLCSVTSLIFISQSGSRRLVVVIIGAALLTWFCGRRRQLRIRYYIVATVVILLTTVFLDFMLAQRKIGYEEISYRRADFEGVKVDDNFAMLGETLRVVPEETDFVGLPFLWYVLVRPIPRVFWKNKPVDPGFDLAQHLGARGVSLSISGIGEMYMSFGWIGILVGGLLFGWIAATWSQVLDWDRGATGAALYGLGAMALLLGIRSLLELILMTYPIFCWFAVDRVLWRKRRVDHQRPLLEALHAR